MSSLLVVAGLAGAAWAIRRIWRMPAKSLRAADIEALAWEQACEPSSNGGGSGLQITLPTLGESSRRASPVLAAVN
ncbi:hypothetical protein [Roseateles agri]|uniref:hypothetical protein n=1 Tax=Roseateles agri TaxID=3098619 RepID=UPI002A5A12AC|nr:hypothetical protein [Paucibacter sp. R3-3]